jgi:hypothetical protein
MALMRPMVAPIMGEWASIVEHIMVIPLTGMVVPAMPMERAAVRQPGTMARGAPQVGAGAPLRGIMDREAPAVSEAARPRGVAAPGARPDGGAARSPGAAVVFTVADSGDDGRTAAAERFAEPDRTSPAAKVPGQFVSNGLGGRLMLFHGGASASA